MAVFLYKALTKEGQPQEGTIEAVNIEVAISSLQKRNLIISQINPADKGGLLGSELTFFSRVSNKDVVILSRQIATLFQAQVSALRVFKLIAAETENALLRKSLSQVADDLQAGSNISEALSKHPKVFSEFYVNMVKAGEESGKLDTTFQYLADYLDRTYEVTSKATHALIYPAFVITVFFGVMILMLTVIIPKITSIIKDSGQEVPFYTKIVIGISDFLVNYGIFLAIAVVLGAAGLWWYSKTPQGRLSFGSFKLHVPYLGTLYRKLYLSRIADNMHTMVLSGIPMVHALEITAAVVGNDIYKEILTKSIEEVRGGSSLSASLAQYPEIPGIMVQMIKVGEETGELGNILKTMADFYRREVSNAVDTLVSMIEPLMIVGLGVGVGILLASVLMPIYNLAGSQN
jgi:type IV pilus assembly protein PilC